MKRQGGKLKFIVLLDRRNQLSNIMSLRGSAHTAVAIPISFR